MFDYSAINVGAMLQRSFDIMKPRQREAVGKGRNRKRLILDAWMGTGKTFILLTANLCAKPQRTLIICSKNAIGTWQAQIAEWYPELVPGGFVIVRGTAAERQNQYRKEGLFYATTMGSFLRDYKWLIEKKAKFDSLIDDELHKQGLRRHSSVGYKAFKEFYMAFEPQWKFVALATGTWITKGPFQMWAALHIMDRKLFRSYWKFVAMFHNSIKGAFGTEIGGPKNTEGLALVTAPYVYTITKEQANEMLPPLVRQRLNTYLESPLDRVYTSLETELYYEWEASVESVVNKLAASIKLRQLICCPAILNPAWGVGPALEICTDKMLDMDDVVNWKHNIIFTPFLDAIPYYKDHLIKVIGYKPEDVLITKGGISVEELSHIENRFRKEPQTCIISSIRYSEAWNAETAFNLYFPHFEWAQDENMQAEARGRRTSGKQESISAFYVDIPGTVTSAMFENLNAKTHNTNVTYQNFSMIKDQIKARLEAQGTLKNL